MLFCIIWHISLLNILTNLHPAQVTDTRSQLLQLFLSLRFSIKLEKKVSLLNQTQQSNLYIYSTRYNRLKIASKEIWT